MPKINFLHFDQIQQLNKVSSPTVWARHAFVAIYFRLKSSTWALSISQLALRHYSLSLLFFTARSLLFCQLFFSSTKTRFNLLFQNIIAGLEFFKYFCPLNWLANDSVNSCESSYYFTSFRYFFLFPSFFIQLFSKNYYCFVMSFENSLDLKQRRKDFTLF